MAEGRSNGERRRVFSAEFKLEAVRRMEERRAGGVNLTQIGRELGVRPDQLRKWKRQHEQRAGAPVTDVFPGQGKLPSEQEELRRLQRENARLQQEVAFLKVGGGVLREGVAVSDKYAAIQAHQGDFPVRLMCEALDVSISGYYDAVARAAAPPSTRAVTDERLRVHVRAVHRKSRGRYGAPRVHEELKAQGERVAKKRVARLMREDGLVGRRRRKFVRTTDSDHAEPVAPNLLGRHFALPDHPVPDRAWCGDLTYIPTREGWLFLAVLLDLASRRVVGWATGATLATTLPLAALDRALRLRRPPPGLIQHTDRGSQYASQEYRAVLAAHGVRQSMSRKGDCWDNAVSESFFATLEHELLADADFHTRREAHHAVAEFIDTWYNGERRHSTLGYVSPMQYEQQLRHPAARAA